MRISIIGPAYPLRGGIAHHVHWLRGELATRGHNVQVVSFRRLYPRVLFPGTTELDTKSNLKLDAGAIPVLKPLSPLTWLRALRLVRAFSPDAIVFQWWQPFFGPLVGTLARSLRRPGTRCIIECHNVFPHEGSLFDRILVKYALSAADHLITHSQRDRDLLLSVLPGKQVSVSALPALDDFYDSRPAPRNGRTILFFGKVRKYKGLDVLLAAMPKVLEKLDCRLNIVGEFYDSPDRYRRLISKYQIDSQVRIDNRYVPNEEVTGVFRDADVLVLPYVSASQSGVARIALSNGLPVIASRIGGLSEAIEEEVTGLLVAPGDAEALADRIVDYFEGNLGPVFSENLRRKATETSQCKIGDIIEDVMTGRSSAASVSTPSFPASY
ncbi:MAG TPA: glycosyltransferase family 4 protein [Blastocatellia bacterium]|nr:glycosyltransferase family 4 protein [Blastocatellia bacterium]